MCAVLPVDKARNVASEGVWLWTARKPEGELDVGITKIGGHPDLPATAPWPARRGKHLAFVAQLDLEAIAEALSPSLLPARGLLTFFVADDPSGETGYLDDCAVLYTQPGAKLVRRGVPDNYAGPIYQACAVELRSVVRLPGRESERASKVLRAGAKAYATEVFDYAIPENQVLGALDHATDNATRANERLLLQLVGDPQAAMTCTGPLARWRPRGGRRRRRWAGRGRASCRRWPARRARPRAHRRRLRGRRARGRARRW